MYYNIRYYSNVSVRESLDIQGWILNDTSTIEHMKDTYPIDLFQLKNSIHEFEQGNNSSAFYIYSIILEIFRFFFFYWFGTTIWFIKKCSKFTLIAL